MKNRFVKITLALTMLLVMAVPAQVFAAEKSCSLSQSSPLSTQLSKICSQLSPSTTCNLSGILSQYQGTSNNAGTTTTKCKNTSCTAGTQCQGVSCSDGTTQCQGKSCTTGVTQLQDLFQKLGLKTQSTSSAPTATTPSKSTPSTTQKTTTTATTPTTTTSATTPTTTSSNSASLSSYEQQVVDLVNKERAAAGLSALTVNTTLTKVAETKAADMRDNNYFSHTSPTYGSPFDMMKQFGISYTTAGENIAEGQKTPADVMNAWMNSEGHRANILNSSYTEIGVGYVTNSNGTGYWVQEFIRP